MKKYILSSLFLLMTISIWAQQKPDRILKVDPFALFVSSVGVHVEQVISDQYSLQVGGSFTTQSVTLWEGLEGRANGYTLNFQGRRYFLPGYEMAGSIAPEGVYLGIWGRYEHLDTKLRIGGDKADMLNGAAYSGGVLAGCQFWVRYKKRPLFLLDAFMGTGYKVADYSGRFAEAGRLIDYARSGIVPRLVVSVGMPL
ncbi:MAG: hypothetical protein AAGI23_09665 [Bacteroidota bacterium]